MIRVIPPDAGHRLPILVWGRVVAEGALVQLERIAALPYVAEHVAAMPDLHVASGVAVGTVFATEGVVVPAALGGDLGCGMSAVRFDFPAAALPVRALREMLAALGARIPVGAALRRAREPGVPDGLLELPVSTKSLEHARERLAPRHLGTLGGGNHFIELDRDSGGDLWLLVHSGSRGLGAAVAAHHIKAAEAQGSGELPGLSVDSDAGRACLSDIGWALRFARANRDRLVREAVEVVAAATGAPPDEASRLDVVHNFVRAEEHFGRHLLVHRKGAIAAEAGQRLLIPGSMGTASYLVEGLGERSSFRSGSHGAGRVMTRKEARQRIAPEKLAHAMRRVVYDERRGRDLVEEAPAAYRDISEVLEDEADLVRPVLGLEPIAVLKG